MFYDRKNIVPEYSIDTFLKIGRSILFNVHKQSEGFFRIKSPINFLFENIGRRPVYINDITMALNNGSSDPDDIVYLRKDFDIALDGLLIKPGELLQKTVYLATIVESIVYSNEGKSLPFKYRRLTRFPDTYTTDAITLHLHNGDTIQSKLTTLKNQY